jgi:hypothetical protein
MLVSLQLRTRVQPAETDPAVLLLARQFSDPSTFVAVGAKSGLTGHGPPTSDMAVSN